MTVAAVLVAAAAGAAARYVLDYTIAARARVFPWGTFTVNVAGSLLLGVVVGLAERGALPAGVKLAAGTGFCGAFTTFSTFAYETARLLEAGARLEAFANVAASVTVSLVAAGAGLGLAYALA